MCYQRTVTKSLLIDGRNELKRQKTGLVYLFHVVITSNLVPKEVRIEHVLQATQLGFTWQS